MFKHLNIVGIDGKTNENSIQTCANHLKKLLPPDLLKRSFLLGLCGRDFFYFFIRFCVYCAGCFLLCARVASIVVRSCCLGVFVVDRVGVVFAVAVTFVVVLLEGYCFLFYTFLFINIIGSSAARLF